MEEDLERIFFMNDEAATSERIIIIDEDSRSLCMSLSIPLGSYGASSSRVFNVHARQD